MNSFVFFKNSDPESTHKKAEILYHMTTKAEWEAAKANDCAYFPRTFDVDGFTHATDVASRLIEVANHFYQVCFSFWFIYTFILLFNKNCKVQNHQ